MTAITWTKTETRTVEEKTEFRLLRQQLGCATFTSEQATAADVIAAIEADEGLRNAVAAAIMTQKFNAATDAMDAASVDRLTWKERAEFAEDALEAARKNGATLASDRDAWKSRGEKAKRDCAETSLELNRASHDIIALEKERDAAIQQRREAEKERDEYAESLDDIDNLIGGDWDVGQRRIDVITAIWRERFEQRTARMAAEKERDEARAEAGTWKNYGAYNDTVIKACHETIARLERELAEAKANAKPGREQ